MFPLKRLAGFCLRLLLFFGLLMAPWPGVTEAYAVLFRTGANLMFGSFGSAGRVHFEPLPAEAEMPYRSRVVLQNRRNGVRGETTNNSEYLGYAPTVVLVALILATPTPWARRRRTLLWGLPAVHGFIAVRVALPLLRLFSGDKPLALFPLSPLWSKALDQAIAVLVSAPPSVYVVPIFIWILVTFRRSDLEQWMERWGDNGRRSA